MPKQLYKLKKQASKPDEALNAPRCCTEYPSAGKSAQIKNRLTKGCQKYE